MAWDMSNILVNLATSGGGGSSELDSRVSALETTVGDSSSGLVKDVNDLETTVGDSSSGLVKDVNDLETTVSTLYPNVYSTEETPVGVWLNKILYRKVYDCGALPDSTTKTVDSGLTNVTVVHMYGYGESTANCIPVPRPDTSASNSISVYYSKANNQIVIKTDANMSAPSSFIVLEYTKNTVPENNTRTKKTKGGK